jgi:hypothetical protein
MLAKPSKKKQQQQEAMCLGMWHGGHKPYSQL